jgi:hypothetical protein
MINAVGIIWYHSLKILIQNACYNFQLLKYTDLKLFLKLLVKKTVAIICLDLLLFIQNNVL